MIYVDVTYKAKGCTFQMEFPVRTTVKDLLEGLGADEIISVEYIDGNPYNEINLGAIGCI